MIKKKEIIEAYLKNLKARQGIVEKQLESVFSELQYNKIIIQDIEEILNKKED